MKYKNCFFLLLNSISSRVDSNSTPQWSRRTQDSSSGSPAYMPEDESREGSKQQYKYRQQLLPFQICNFF